MPSKNSPLLMGIDAGTSRVKALLFEIDGKLVIGLLHKAKPCNEQNINYIAKNEVTGEYCDIRNNTPVESLQSGMGDIFIKLAR